jgi:hypothetical protein
MIAIGIVACGNYDLEVQNKTDDVIDIYVDEFYEGSVAPKNYLLIRHLSRGEHYIEAFDLDEALIADDVIYLDDNSKWIIHESYFRFY